ncbi:response regulator transcription factor [Pseudoalteromonas sp. SWXJZ94C]|uniref:LuxR C-terminal-related transcriptional regulator n=1 Tax=Pseudoalteromonas sp. SWXJZ94C TaxID=2792065 RepID=UPI0018CF5F74|nr:response regulator transcription factor [Pseudoalteromonas sp. SWXJZ94C]MBH0057318.1 response regulator transcription factor [Pseudoalteromonas sp. SWXJZ94C]
MRQSIFITQPEFESKHWHSAFPGCIVCTKEPNRVAASNIIWILANTPNWLTIVKKYTQQRLPVIVMTNNLDIDELRMALQAGARGYVEALASKVIIEQVLETICSDATWIPGQLLSNLVGALSKANFNYSHTCNLDVLTKRERQVVDIVVTGATNKQAAQSLSITERTIKEHMGSIFNKLKVRDRIQLMLVVKGN